MNELEIIQHRQIEGLSIFFDTVDYRTSHVHPEWELLWLLKNSLSISCGQNTFMLEPGQITLFGPNKPHEFHKTDQGATFLCLQISSEILPALPPLSVDGKNPQAYFSDQEMTALKKRIVRLTQEYLSRKENYQLYCAGESCLLLYQLLSRLPTSVLTPEEASSIQKRNARLTRLIRFVDENYMHKIRLADFAESEGCSMSYLSHFIKETLNQSFQEYVTSVRFNCACKLIAAGGMRMLDVCMESGFSDYRYFSRAFQQQYNMTPEAYSQYKRKLQLEAPAVRHSLHSVERFYSRDESLKLINQYFQYFL